LGDTAPEYGAAVAVDFAVDDSVADKCALGFLGTVASRGEASSKEETLCW